MLRHGSLVAINVTIDDNGKNILISKQIPILYYCNEADDITESISRNDTVKSFVAKNIIDPYLYANSCVNYISFDIGSDNENYVEGHMKVQDWFEISKEIENQLLKDISASIYLDVFNAKYLKTDTIENIVKDVYEKISLMYQEKITKNTFLNYFRKKLNDNNINESNKNIILKRVSDIVATTEKNPDDVE